MSTARSFTTSWPEARGREARHRARGRQHRMTGRVIDDCELHLLQPAAEFQEIATGRETVQLDGRGTQLIEADLLLTRDEGQLQDLVVLRVIEDTRLAGELLTLALGHAAEGRLPREDQAVVDRREQRRVIEEHYRLAEEIYGPQSCGRQMRKFGIKYSRLHPEGLAVRDAQSAQRALIDRHRSEG